MSRYINLDKQLVRLYRLGLSNEEVIKQFLLTADVVDVVEVVRCKDCKMYRKDKELAEAQYCNPNYYCGLLQTEMDEDGFCSYGRHKDE